RLDRLGAAITKERHAIEVGALAERLREQGLRLRVPRVWDVDERGDLLLNGLHDARRAVAEDAAAPAGEEVQVAVTFRVPDPRALAADEAHGVSGVVADDVLLRQG